MKPTILSIVLILSFFALKSANAQNSSKMTYDKYVRDGAPSKKEIDVFINELSWAQFDPELGYILGNYMPHDGYNNSSSISTSQANGTRTSFIYSDKPGRINTYGNSFTQCHQVSDAETWQEYLAGHLGEPVRNFGMGGYGTYQAYRRMLREEQTANNSEYMLFYIWGDDHIRSLLRCRYMTFREWRDNHSKTEGEGIMFHGNFWANLEMSLKTGKFEENDSRIKSAEALYNMTDPNWLAKNLKGDWALQMYLFQQGKIDEVNIPKLKKLSEHLALNLNWDAQNLKASVSTLLNKYAFAATKYILNKTKNFAIENNKKLLVVLFDPYKVTKGLLNGQPRYDQEIVDFLTNNEYKYFDMNLVHVNDYKDFNLSVDDYYKRYFVGHYSPSGNHFFAYSIMPTIVDWLSPKPITYQKKDVRAIDFKGYLNDY